jgi:hypothetical protein
MNSAYELELLAKLAYKHTIEKAQERRFAQSVERQGVITNDEYRQFVVREERPCPC